MSGEIKCPGVGSNGTMKTKTILLGATTVLLLAAGGGVVAWQMTRPAPFVVFADTSRVTFLGVDYGQKHVPPRRGFFESDRHSPPRPPGTPFTTSNDVVVGWFRQQYNPKNW